MKILLKSLLLLAPISSALAGLPATVHNRVLVTYWGQNKASNVIDEPVNQELPLDQLCNLEQYSVIVLSFMMEHFATNNMPGLDFSKWCNVANAYPGYPAEGGRTTLLQCNQIGSWIQTCQQRGKKVILGISPMAALTTAEDGTRSANNVWNLFLGGTGGNIRPFGSGVVLDGVDLYIRNNNMQGYVEFITRLRSLMRTDNTRPYYISASPVCSFATTMAFGLGKVIQDVGASNNIDWVNVFFTSSPDCTFNANPAGFWSTFNEWTNWGAEKNMKIVVGLPAVGYGGYEARVDAGRGDFIDATVLQEDNVVGKMREKNSFGGVALFDSSFEYLKPCNNTAKTYSRLMYDQLTGNANAIGPNTSPICVPNPEVLPKYAARKPGRGGSYGSNGMIVGSKHEFAVMAFAIMTVLLVQWF